MIRLVLLDIDDTLLPTTETFWAAVEEVLRGRYGDEADELQQLVLRLVYFFGTTEYRGFWLAFCAERGLEGEAQKAEHEALTRAYKAAYARRITARTGARETLMRLSGEGRTIGVVSNGRTPFQRMKLSRSGLADLIDGPLLVSGDFPDGTEKPGPGLFEEALRRTSHEPREALFVGDRTDDVIGGNLAGIYVVRFHTPHQSPAPPMLKIAQPYATIDALDELHALLARLDGQANLRG